MATVCELRRFVPKMTIFLNVRPSGREERQPTFEYDTKRAFSDLLPHSVVDANEIGGARVGGHLRFGPASGEELALKKDGETSGVVGEDTVLCRSRKARR
jgi:hypothetical protein